MIRTCRKCNEEKPLAAFKTTKKLGQPKKICITCERHRANENHKKWRTVNPEQKKQMGVRWVKSNHDKYLEYCRASNKKARRRKAKAVFEYLAKHPCVDCGESDLRVLDFDHVSGEKLLAVRTMLSRSWRIDLIFDEIAKCEVRCANCHRKVTVARGNLLSWLDLTIDK